MDSGRGEFEAVSGSLSGNVRSAAGNSVLEIRSERIEGWEERHV